MQGLPHIFECSVCHRVFSGRFGVSPEDRSIWRPVLHGAPRYCPGAKLEAIITDQAEFEKIKHLLRKTRTERDEEDLARYNPADRPFVRALQIASLQPTISECFHGEMQAVVDKYIGETIGEQLQRLRAALSRCLDALNAAELPEGSALSAARDAVREALEKDKPHG